MPIGNLGTIAVSSARERRGLVLRLPEVLHQAKPEPLPIPLLIN